MANSLLTFSMLANLGCSVGLDLGFNACECYPIYHDQSIEFRWCDKSQLRPLSRMRPDGARAYDEMASTMRKERSAYFSDAIREWDVDSVKRVLTQVLLEVAE